MTSSFERVTRAGYGGVKGQHVTLAGMRVNLISHASASFVPGKSTIPLTLTIRPSCGVPGDYCYTTDSSALLKMLRRETDLPASVIGNFETKLYDTSESRLLGVELNDRTLTEIGYFVD